MWSKNETVDEADLDHDLNRAKFLGEDGTELTIMEKRALLTLETWRNKLNEDRTFVVGSHVSRYDCGCGCGCALTHAPQQNDQELQNFINETPEGSKLRLYLVRTVKESFHFVSSELFKGGQKSRGEVFFPWLPKVLFGRSPTSSCSDQRRNGHRAERQRTFSICH